MSKRDLFEELSTALHEAKAHSEGKLTLKTHVVEHKPEFDMTPAEIVSIRESFKMSRSVFAELLRTSSRTLENWEQGRSVPNGQALTLLKLVQARPQTLEDIAAL